MSKENPGSAPERKKWEGDPKADELGLAGADRQLFAKNEPGKRKAGKVAEEGLFDRIARRGKEAVTAVGEVVKNDPRVKHEVAKRGIDRRQKLLLEQVGQRSGVLTSNVAKGPTIDTLGHKIEINPNPNERQQLILAVIRHEMLNYIFNKYPSRNQRGMSAELAESQKEVDSLTRINEQYLENGPGSTEALVPPFTNLDPADMVDLCTLMQENLENDSALLAQPNATHLDGQKVSDFQGRKKMYEEIKAKIMD